MAETTLDGGGEKYIFTAYRETIGESTNDIVTTAFNVYLDSVFNLLPELSTFCLSICEIKPVYSHSVSYHT